MIAQPAASTTDRAVSLRRGPADRSVVAAAAGQGVVTSAAVVATAVGWLPVWLLAALFAFGVWWNANTVAHIHIHTPIFRTRRANRLFALYLTGLTAVPFTLWRARHLWHHAGEPADRPPRIAGPALAAELVVIGLACTALGAFAPGVLAGALAPGWLAALGLCYLHGRYEHAGAPLADDPGVSCYGRWYNRLWFNDGYHAEHHRQPGAHWTTLPERRRAGTRASRLPPIARWLPVAGVALNRWAAIGLDGLEHLALWSPHVRRWLIERHTRALSALASELLTAPRHVVVVGGGLFPRTALVCATVWPAARVTVLESSAAHIGRARGCLGANEEHGGRRDVSDRITFRHVNFDGTPLPEADLVVTPLGYRGDRRRLYACPPAPIVLIHDWLWRRRGDAGAVVSPFLLKRLNLVRAAEPVEAPAA